MQLLQKLRGISQFLKSESNRNRNLTTTVEVQKKKKKWIDLRLMITYVDILEQGYNNWQLYLNPRKWIEIRQENIKIFFWFSWLLQLVVKEGKSWSKWLLRSVNYIYIYFLFELNWIDLGWLFSLCSFIHSLIRNWSIANCMMLILMEKFSRKHCERDHSLFLKV